jgi:hypothetical protein
VKLQHLFD